MNQMKMTKLVKISIQVLRKLARKGNFDARKLVKSIDSCLEENNFDPVDLPGEEKILTAYLERPKRKNDP